MKKFLCLSFLAIGLATPTLASPNAANAKSASTTTGQIVKVERQRVSFPPYAGVDTPTDAPLQSSYYAFDLSVQVSCTTYHRRYESILNFLPSTFGKGQNIPVRITKRGAYFDAPDGEEMKLFRVRHPKESPNNCADPNRVR